MMKMFVLSLALLGASPAAAACYADYKAKQDNPLRLHYGVIQLTDNVCNMQSAGPVISGRIAGEGWTLLEVVSIFDDSGLASRQENAGQFFLRF